MKLLYILMSNCYISDPVKVCVYDPVKNLNKRVYCVLGNITPTLRAAAIKGSDKLLTDFYGRDWKDKLASSVDKPAQHLYKIIDGGNSDVNSDNSTTKIGGDFDIDEFEKLLAEEQKQPDTADLVKNIGGISIKSDMSNSAETEYVSDIFIYPEDKFIELKEKISIFTGIPAYRQHLFYMSKGRLNTTYKLYAEGLYNIDIRDLKAADNQSNLHVRSLGNVTIDKVLYDLRDEIRIETLEDFQIIGPHLERVVYVVDINHLLAANAAAINEILTDSYQLDLLYYGFVMKYWPQLSKEAFVDLLSNESDLYSKYPDLAKTAAAVKKQYQVEAEIVNRNYALLPKLLNSARKLPISTSIMQLTATTNTPKIAVNIRNLFDSLRVTRCIPEIHAYIEHEGRRYLLRKRHIRNGSDIVFPAGAVMKNGLIIAISLRKSDQDSFHHKVTLSTMENEQTRYMFLNILNNGRYFVRILWNEEDEVQFDEALKAIKKFVDPIVNGINKLGRVVFPGGDSLHILTKSNIVYQSLNISIFWKKIMLESSFKYLRQLWEPYLAAGIIRQRNVAQHGNYEFYFRKGMHEYDTNIIDRIVAASTGLVLTNHYSHLWNSAIKQKWDQNYDGRIVKMVHRTTDIKFEILNIRDVEFYLFRNYILAWIQAAACDEKLKLAPVTKINQNVKKIKKNREQDPELYNIKKYDTDKIYSVICQLKNQPIMYTDEEVKQLQNRDSSAAKKLVKYYNFTLKRPAYYSCPNPDYPNLSFIVDAHAKGYCLPCCKKSEPGSSSKKSHINHVCLTKHIYKSTDEVAASRHIMSYGKELDIGRISKLPNQYIKMLFDSNVQDAADSNFYVYGVPQHAIMVKNVGMIYAAADCLNLDIKALIGTLINRIKATAAKSTQSINNVFQTVLGGRLIDYFASFDDVIANIKDIFIAEKQIIVDVKMSKFAQFKLWNELIAELLFLFLGCHIYVFIDRVGTGEDVTLYIPNYIRSLLDEDTRTSNTVLFMIKKQNRYYPIYLINTESYFKYGEITKKTFNYTAAVVKAVLDTINLGKQEAANIRGPDLNSIKEFAAVENLNIIAKYINKHNVCYGVLLNCKKNNQTMWFPIEYSIHSPDGICLAFNAPGYGGEHLTGSRRFVEEIIAKFNTHSKKHHIEIVRYLQNAGEVFAAATNGNLIFYFTPIAAADLKLPVVDHYDPRAVNNVILRRLAATGDNRISLAAAALYNNYLYQLFLVEIITYLDKDRNHEIRGRLIELINVTNFKKELGKFRMELRRLLKASSAFTLDLKILQNQVGDFYYTHMNKSQLINVIETAVYDFDRITMNKLKSLLDTDFAAAITMIKDIAGKITSTAEPKINNFSNIYVACDDKSSLDHCINNKLAIGARVSEFAELFAADIKDGLRSRYLVDSVFVNNIIDYMRFETIPTEIITIYKVSE